MKAPGKLPIQVRFPCSGLVSERFNVSKVETLIGVLFFAHQIGAFFSAWLGGVLRQTLGGYTAVWMIDVALCAFACLMSLRIKAIVSSL